MNGHAANLVAALRAPFVRLTSEGVLGRLCEGVDARSHGRCLAAGGSARPVRIEPRFH
jgi:hypothetical protein